MAEQKFDRVPKLLQMVLPDGPLKFGDVIATSTQTSQSLERKVGELISGTFADYIGCKIEALKPEMLKCKLYFKPCFNKSENETYAIKVKGENVQRPSEGPTLFSTLIRSVNENAPGKKQFELEHIAKELLAEFLIISPDNAKYVERYNESLGKIVKVRLPKNWNNYVSEIAESTVGQYSNIFVAVTVDLLPLVAKLYGRKDAKEERELEAEGKIPKDRYQYSVNVVKIIDAATASFLLEVKRIDSKALNKLLQSVGYGNVQGNIVMTRA